MMMHEQLFEKTIRDDLLSEMAAEKPEDAAWEDANDE